MSLRAAAAKTCFEKVPETFFEKIENITFIKKQNTSRAVSAIRGPVSTCVSTQAPSLITFRHLQRTKPLKNRSTSLSAKHFHLYFVQNVIALVPQYSGCIQSSTTPQCKLMVTPNFSNYRSPRVFYGELAMGFHAVTQTRVIKIFKTRRYRPRMPQPVVQLPVNIILVYRPLKTNNLLDSGIGPV